MKSLRGLYFQYSLFLCVCKSVSVCLSVFLSMNKIGSQTDASISMDHSLNGCLAHSLEPIENDDL